jgi:hypothetical protein
LPWRIVGSLFATSAIACSAPTSSEESIGSDQAAVSKDSSLQPHQISQATYDHFTDDPSIDKSVLALPAKYVPWKCRHEDGGVTGCIGVGIGEAIGPDPADWVPCEAYYSRTAEPSVAYRRFNSEGLVIERIVNNNATEVYSANADGSGNRSEGSYDYIFHDVFTTPGDTSEFVQTLIGRDNFAKMAVPSGGLLWIDRGSLTNYPDGSFVINSGRFDLWTDPDAAFGRLCAGLYP